MKTKNFFAAAGIVVCLFSTASAQNFQWAKAMGGNNYDYGNSIATDVSGNVYTTGSFVGTADFDPGPGIYNLTAVSSEDIFVSKSDATGNFIWAKSIGGSGNDQGRSIAVDGNGNVYTTGRFVLTADFDPGPDTFNLTSAASGNDIFVCKLDTSGNFVWAKQLGGTGWDNGASIAIDGNGNVYTSGSFEGTADFDPGAGTFNLTSIGSGDIFISKLDASGNFIWAIQMGGTGSDNGASIAIDAGGNVYTTGIFQSTVDFDPGAGIFNLTSVSGSLDFFVSKLDTAGNFIWAKAMGGSGEDKGFSIAVDISGNVYTTGSFDGVADFDPGAGTSNLTPGGFTDIFVSKLDPSGDFIWAKQMGGTSGDISNSIALDGGGNVYTAGLFQSTADFDPGAGTFDLTAINGEDIFISKLDASGNFIWAKQMGGPGYENASCIWVDGNGNVYTTGFFENTVDFDPDAGAFNVTSAGSRDIYIHKMSPVGQQINLDSGLVAHYPFNGNANDESGNGNNGTVNGATLTTDRFGNANKAYSFNGNNYIVHPTNGLSSENGTLAGWINPTQQNSWGFWQTHDNNSINWNDWIAMFAWTSGNFYFRMGDGAGCCNNDLIFNTASNIPVNQWSFFTFSWEGTTMKIYVNGIKIVERNNASLQPIMDSSARIGWSHTVGMMGNIDDISIYNRALNNAEIQALFNDTVIVSISFTIANFSSSTVCKGDSTLFTDLSSGNDTITSWNWNFGDTASGSANISILQNPKHLFTNSGVYNVTLIASGSSASDTITKQVVVNALPQANAGTDKTICEGSGVYLYATGGNSYQWTPSTGLNCTNCQQPYASPSDTASYIVTVTNTNNCSAQDTVVVNVAPIPSPLITPPGDTICQGNSTTLDGSAGYTAYSWNSGQTTQTATVSQPGWYYVWVTNSAGCWGQSPSVYVGIKSAVTVTVSPSATVCEGDVITLSAMGWITYQWSDGSTGPSINVTSSGTYTLTVSDGICSMVSSPVSITVKDTNITPQVYLYGDTSFCDGGYVWLEAQTGFNTYQWSNGVNTNWNYITSSGTYDVTVTDMCGSYASQPITVTEYAIPNPAVTPGGSTTLCQGQNVTLTAPNGYSYYYWPQTGTSLQSILVAYEGDYFCWVQNGNGCWGASDTISVTVGPDVYITPAGSSTICDGNSLAITANGTNIVSYQWSSGETTQSINATATAVYNVTVTDNNSCTGAAPYALNLTVLDTNPVPVIYLAYNDSVLCQGEYVYMYTDCNYQQYQWSNNVTSCGQYVDQGGNYSVTVNNGCGTGASVPVNISVNTLPLVNAGNDVTICGGQNTTLSASGGVSYQWYPSYGLSCTSCQSPVASPAYTTTYTVYGTDAAGCQGWDNVTVSVEPASVSFSASPTVQYLPDDPGTIYFTYTGSIANITAYLWDFGDGNQSTAVNPVHTYTTKGWYDISLTVTNNSGCSTTIIYYDYILIEQIFPATTMNSGTTNNINGVSFISGYNGWTAMSDGNVLITNDGGTTWTTGYVNAGVPLWGIYLIGNAGYVVGDNGFISVSYDGGVSWSNFVTGVSYALYNVYLSSFNYGFAVGANGTILQYNGTNWTSVNLGITVDLNAVYTYGLFTYIVGDGGLILKYDGFAWDTLITNVTVDLNSIYFINNLVGYAAGADGTIIMTSDGGVIWTTVFSGIASSFTSIAPITGDSVIAVGSDGIVYLSIDGGLNWGRYSIGDNRLLYGVSVVNDGWGGYTGYIAGAAGGVFKFEKAVVTPVEETVSLNERKPVINIYPNPVTDVLKISIANFKLQIYHCKFYDVIGREVMNVTMNGESTIINCNGLEPGIYFIWVIANEKTATGRFIKVD